MSPGPFFPDRTAATQTWVGRGLLFIAVVFMLEHARPVLLPIAIAIVFAFVLSWPVRALRRRGIHEYLGSALVILAVLSAVALLFLLVAAPAAAWWSRAPEIVHQLVEALQGWRDALFPYAPPEPLARSPAAGPPADPFNERLASEGWTFTRLAIGGTISFALSASATVILLYFLLASEHWLVTRTVQAIARPRTRALVLSGFRQAERDIGLFISTMSIINVALGIATGVALGLIGMPNPVLWGTTTAVLAFIPYIGPLLITVLLLLAGNVTYGAEVWMLAPPAVFLVLHGIEANFLSPMFMGHRLRLRPLFVFLSVILWGWLWGIAGAFLAVPMLLALRAACRRTSRLRVVCTYLQDD